MPNGDHLDYPPESDADVFKRVLQERDKYKKENQELQEVIVKLREKITLLKSTIRLVNE